MSLSHICTARMRGAFLSSTCKCVDKELPTLCLLVSLMMPLDMLVYLWVALLVQQTNLLNNPLSCMAIRCLGGGTGHSSYRMTQSPDAKCHASLTGWWLEF